MIKRLIRKLRLWNKPWNPFFSPSLFYFDEGYKIVARGFAEGFSGVRINRDCLDSVHKRIREILGTEDGDK